MTSTDYPYYKYVKSPSQLGMSSKGSLAALGKDVEGLISYVELLVSGKSAASATGKPLGNKFFLHTGGTCMGSDKVGGDPVGKEDRYVYIDNVPAGNVPFISSGMGVNFTEFRGLIPGAISNLNAFNPESIFHAFTAGSTPQCVPLTMQTIDNENKVGSETHYVTVSDIQDMDPCSFPSKKNPVTGQACKEAFGNHEKEEPFARRGGGATSDAVFIASLIILAIFIAFAWIKRTFRPGDLTLHYNVQLFCVIACVIAVMAS